MTADGLQLPHRPTPANIAVRPERVEDHAAIHDLTGRAFAPMPFSDGDEQYLIDALRKADALSLSLVAEQDQSIVGHVAFSPAFPVDGSPGWYALGPVSAEPELQKAGIGRRLIETGLDQLRAQGAAGCILLGNPAYYSRFGFAVRSNLSPDADHAEFFSDTALRHRGCGLRDRIPSLVQRKACAGDGKSLRRATMATAAEDQPPTLSEEMARRRHRAGILCRMGWLARYIRLAAGEYAGGSDRGRGWQLRSLLADHAL